MATDDEDLDLEYQGRKCCGSETCPPGYEEGSPCRKRWNWGVAITFGPVWIMYVVWIINDTSTAVIVAAIVAVVATIIVCLVKKRNEDLAMRKRELKEKRDKKKAEIAKAKRDADEKSRMEFLAKQEEERKAKLAASEEKAALAAANP